MNQQWHTDALDLLLMELDDLAVRLRVQEGRFPGDPEVLDLKREITKRRALVLDALALVQVDATRPATLH